MKTSSRLTPIDHARTIANELHVNPDHPGTARLAQALALALDLPDETRWVRTPESHNGERARQHPGQLSLNAIETVSASRLKLASIM